MGFSGKGKGNWISWNITKKGGLRTSACVGSKVKSSFGSPSKKPQFLFSIYLTLCTLANFIKCRRHIPLWGSQNGERAEPEDNPKSSGFASCYCYLLKQIVPVGAA